MRAGFADGPLLHGKRNRRESAMGQKGGRKRRNEGANVRSLLPKNNKTHMQTAQYICKMLRYQVDAGPGSGS